MDNLTRERFEEKIDKSAGCHVWTGAKSNIGYGQLKIRGKIHYAHRLAYELAKGPIPDGRVIDHICHNRACVNPDHLQSASQKQNAENARLNSASSTGYRGVSKMPNGRFMARAIHNYKAYYAGTHDTAEQASEAAIALRNRLFTNNLLDR